MSARHSSSLLLVWRVAEAEARNLRAETLEPEHFLLGLCKVVDLDLVRLVECQTPNRDEVLEELLRETRRLRQTFADVGLDAKAFRRRYRKLHTESNFAAISPEDLRRSDEARSAFRMAENLAAGGGSPVFPLHLLIAMLEHGNARRDRLLTRMSCDAALLAAAARRHCIPPSVPPREVGMN